MVNNTALLDTLKVFYNNKTNRETFLNIILHRSKISLRLLDFLCTKYSRQRNCEIIGTDGKKINIYNHYRSQLRAYSKKLLDPFCRRERCEFTIMDDTVRKELTIMTTIAQLNFFRWVIHYKIIDFAKDNLQEIEDAMNQNSSSHTKRISKKPATTSSTAQPSFKITFE